MHEYLEESNKPSARGYYRKSIYKRIDLKHVAVNVWIDLWNFIPSIKKSEEKKSIREIMKSTLLQYLNKKKINLNKIR